MSKVWRYDLIEMTDGSRRMGEKPDGQYVKHADYAKLEAVAQALREELKNRTAECNGLHEMLRQEHDRTEKAREQVAALRARVVVVPERRDPLKFGHMDPDQMAADGFNDCLDELTRLNGKAVSEGLLRECLAFVDNGFHGTDALELMDKLRTALGEGKEVGDGGR